MLRGILTQAAAARIKRPELAGVEVEYSILHAGLSGEVRYQGKFLVACVEIGPRGIKPIQEQERSIQNVASENR